MVNGAVGLMESNKFPPTKATINMPSAPKKLKPPITAPRPLAGAELPIRDIADKLAKISPNPS